MDKDRRRFHLVGGRTTFVDQTPTGVTRTHVASAPDEDGAFWPVCGTPVSEGESLAEGVFEVLRREVTCRKCQRTREPMLPRSEGVGGGASWVGRYRWV